MSTPPLKKRSELVEEFIRRLRTYSPEITWFGSSSVGRALAVAFGGAVHSAHALYTALLRRTTLLASAGAFTTLVARERGVERLGAQHAKVLVILQPYAANVAGIRTVGPDDYIEIDDSSPFAATDSIRIRNGDGTVTEVAVVASISVGTGLVNGDDEIVVSGGLTGSYTPASDDVDVLLRYTVAAETVITTSVGVSFETLQAVTVGDANPVLDGEGTYVGLADKVWCECQTAGATGNIDAGTVTGTNPVLAKLRGVYNPEPGTGGADEETDFDLKYRTAHYPSIQAQETLPWLLATAQGVNEDVLRALRTDTSFVSTMAIKVLHRNGGTFSASELAEIEAYLDDRTRSYMTTSVSNITLTSVEVEAVITLDPDANLEEVWRLAASRLAAFLDFRKWTFGADVDEADLLAIVKQTPGVATLETSTFLPASDVSVGDESLPVLSSLSLEDADTGDTINADLAVGF